MLWVCGPCQVFHSLCVYMGLSGLMKLTLVRGSEEGTIPTAPSRIRSEIGEECCPLFSGIAKKGVGGRRMGLRPSQIHAQSFDHCPSLFLVPMHVRFHFMQINAGLHIERKDRFIECVHYVYRLV